MPSFDLHVLGTPPAFILSQDQTLRKTFYVRRRRLSVPLQLLRFRRHPFRSEGGQGGRCYHPRLRPSRRKTRQRRRPSFGRRLGFRPVGPDSLSQGGPGSLTPLSSFGCLGVFPAGDETSCVYAVSIPAPVPRSRGERPSPAGQTSRRPSNACDNVWASAYSRSPPEGSPRARRVTRKGKGSSFRRRKRAVASPSSVGVVARITSCTPPAENRPTSSSIRTASGTIPV